MSRAPAHKFFTVSPACPFIKTIAAFLHKEAAFSLEDWTIYLPTRLACFALESALREQSQKEALLLPRMMPLGEVDPVELMLKGGVQQIPAPLSRPRRLVLLAELLSKFRYQETSLSFQQRLGLAENLVGVIDTLRREGVPLSALKALAVENKGAEHWAHIQLFLSVIADHWDTILAEENALDPAQWQRHMMAAHQKQLQSVKTPVMVAGSLGTVSSTVSLMKTVAQLPRGVVVFPGLYKGRDGEVFSPKHPQYFLYRLLSLLEVPSDAVRDLSFEGAPKKQDFSALFDAAEKKEKGACDIHYLSAPDQRAEGEMIALAVREALHRGKKRIVCLSPDTTLLSHVSGALKAWGINVPAPEAQRLIAGEMGRFLHALTLWFAEDVTPDHLRVVFHHPAAQARAPLWEDLEKNIFRSAPGAFSFKRFWKIFNEKKEDFENKDALADFLAEVEAHTPTGQHFTMGRFLSQIEKLSQWVLGHTVPMAEILAIHKAEAFQDLWRDLEKTNPETKLERNEVSDIFLSLLQEKNLSSFRSGGGVQLLTPVEGRFVQADMVILGGLNEGIWPRDVCVDPFFTRAMQNTLGLLPLDHPYGQSAHDYISHLSGEEVLLTYAAKVGGSPALPSEFLSYLRSFMAKNDLPFKERKDLFSYWGALRAAEKGGAIKPPAPKADPSVRPQRFSVSDVMSLGKDPYSFYAKHILKLRPLVGGDQQASRRHFGIFVHALLEAAAQDKKNLPEKAREIFEAFFGAPEKHAFLWGKSQFILEWFKKQPHPARFWTEGWGHYDFTLNGTRLTLFAKADRIDVVDKSATIIDYKTGQIPSQAAIKRGDAPQLPLEGLILKKGKFDDLSPGLSLKELAHWKVTVGDEEGGIFPIKEDLSLLLEETEAGLFQLLSHFQKPEATYLSYPHGRSRKGDYDHLSRVAEWYTERGEE